MVMGRPEGAGCFCKVNDLLRYGIETLSLSYDITLVDCEAGPEQVNRRVVRSVDTLVIVTDTSIRGIHTAGVIKKTAEECGMSVDTFQSNHEGDLIEKIYEALDGYDVLIINPAAYTHTSVAIRDALLMLDIPIIEVHLSNIYRREPFRQKSMMADVATAQLAGFGKDGYTIAVRAAAKMSRRA